MDCLFCDIAAKTIPSKVVYEDEAHIAFLDIQPQDTGHTLVVSKAHYPNLFEMPEAAYIDLWNVVRRVESHLRQAALAERTYVKVIGTDVAHVHIHLIPSSFDGVTDKTNLVAVAEKILVYSKGS
jgi:histidine triad (HIT) family protein